ncbi:MAG: FMN-binding protein [Treponema sp.]|nr:FMN-binding protein [Treponema sp.]
MKTNLLFLFFLCASIITACVGSNPAAAEPEIVSEGAGQGYRGLIRVLVRSNSNGIQSIEVIGHEDDEFIGGAAMESLSESIVESNSTDMDAVSGATESSRGFLEAVRNALHSRK